MRSLEDEVCKVAKAARSGMPARFLAPALAACAIGMAGARPLQAQNAVPTLREQLVGTWSVVSQFTDKDGQRMETFGAHPKGMVVYDVSGRFVGLVESGELPRFLSGNRMTGSIEENQAIVQGSIAYFGHYTVDEKAGKVTLRFEGCTYPNWEGQDQTRTLSFAGNALDMTIPNNSLGGVGHIVLSKAK